MKHQCNQFSQEYEHFSFEILLSSSYDDDILEGSINFFDILYPDTKGTKKYIANIIFYIFNAYNLDEILLLADGISSDLEYVASAYGAYSNEAGGMGAVAIIDEFYLTEEAKNFYEKVQINKCFLIETIEKLQIIGTGTLIFMSKALILNLSKSERILLINELLDINFIPIYQDANDVVLARNLDYIV